MKQAELESVRHAFFALNLQGTFSNTLLCQQIREFLENGADQSMLKPLLKRISPSVWRQAGEELETAEKLGVRTASIVEPEYPKLLKEIADPPPLLFYRGQLSAGEPFSVVGTRKASSYGARVARALGEQISKSGGTVVSGLALGVDSEAHLGAVTAAQQTDCSAGIAVLGSGLSEIYPRQHRSLAEAMLASRGAVLSEYGLRQHPRRDLFPRRNRIISGLSAATIVVEAARKSGSLITARLALEQNRDVFALPGPIDSPYSTGTNELLRQGAEVLCSLSELQERFPSLRPAANLQRPSLDRLLQEIPGLAEDRCRVLCERLRTSAACSIEELAQLTAFSTQEIIPILSRLELSGFVARGADQRYRLLELIDS